MHVVVVYGKQGAGSGAEQLPLTDQLIDAAMGEFSVVANWQPRLIVGDFNVVPIKIPSRSLLCLTASRLVSGLICKHAGLLLLVLRR